MKNCKKLIKFIEAWKVNEWTIEPFIQKYKKNNNCRDIPHHTHWLTHTAEPPSGHGITYVLLWKKTTAQYLHCPQLIVSERRMAAAISKQRGREKWMAKGRRRKKKEIRRIERKR